MLNFLKNIFGFGKTRKTKERSVKQRRVYQEHDIVDYDGMGNQGRFPLGD